MQGESHKDCNLLSNNICNCFVLLEFFEVDLRDQVWFSMIKPPGLVMRTKWGSALKCLAQCMQETLATCFCTLSCMMVMKITTAPLSSTWQDHTSLPFEVGLAMTGCGHGTWDEWWVISMRKLEELPLVSIPSSCAVTHRAQADMRPSAGRVPESSQVFLPIHAAYTVSFCHVKPLSFRDRNCSLI